MWAKIWHSICQAYAHVFPVGVFTSYLLGSDSCRSFPCSRLLRGTLFIVTSNELSILSLCGFHHCENDVSLRPANEVAER